LSGLRLMQYSDIIAAGVVVGIVMMLIVPMPPRLLDLLLVLNIGGAVLTLMVTMYTRNALEFASFPSLLLVATLFRLALNVSGSRLILSQAYAGEVIRSFGDFVVRGNLVVGAVVFAILVVIQLVVITNGAGRVAEVAARFTLDAMPGKQMAVDADLNAGLINEEQARQRRREIEREADFYGAMDGASKFVRGDAIAAIVIIAVNILGGFVVGVAQHQMSVSESLATYTRLTIGEGLVTQIPALLISTATGIIVTRAASEGHLGFDLASQILAHPRAAAVTAGMLVALPLLPGLPKLPFLGMALLTGLTALSLRGRPARAPTEAKARATPPEDVSAALRLDTIALELGYSLVALAQPGEGGGLLERVTALRRQLASELGLVVAPIRIRDNAELAPTAYSIKLRGAEVAQGEAVPECLLAIAPAEAQALIEGVRTKEPAFGLPAVWIRLERRAEAEGSGYTVVEPVAVVVTHLGEVIKDHAAELLGRQETRELLNRLRETQAALVEELIPEHLSAGQVQKVLQGLLAERVCVRDLVTILETLADRAPVTKDTDALLEAVRVALARTICADLQDGKGNLQVVSLEPATEQVLREGLREVEGAARLALEPRFAQRIIQAVARGAERLSRQGQVPVVLTALDLRLPLRRLLRSFLPRVAVVCASQVPAAMTVVPVETVNVQ